MSKLINQIFSFILPVTVLIIIPLIIENDFSIKETPASVSGLAFIITGLYFIVSTVALFIKIGKGTLAPWSPTGKLVISGLYRYVRNPMIIGVLMVLIGESVLFLSVRIFIWAVLFIIINTVYFILYEEPDLEKKFGEEYSTYKKYVNRWLPRFKPYISR
jgi:protein-S-isoprenylcysteine O-methyltransferase Ste14